MQGNVAIKGTRNGLLLTLENATDFQELLATLESKLAASPQFFRGATIAINTAHRNLIEEEHQRLQDLLHRYHMSYLPLESLDAFGQVSPSIDSWKQSGSFLTQKMQNADTLFLHRTVRSGQAIQHLTNIVIIGDVNPGSEIVAGGDIIVWGALRGLVHAGYPNKVDAVVASLFLSPVQLRIAHLLSRSPEGEQNNATKPEMAFIREEQIFVESWINNKKQSRI